MERLKSLFPTLYTMAEVGLLAEGLAVLVTAGFSLAWLGATLAAVPYVAFMAWLFLAPLLPHPKGRTSEGLPGLHWATAVAFGVAVVGAVSAPGFAWRPVLYAALSLVGNYAYTHWYSRLGRRPSAALAVGATLPPFALEDDDGRPLPSQELVAHGPTVWLFFRGNWCPLCMAQVREVAAQYRALADRGAQVVLVSAQSHAKTAALAARFDVPFVFARDPWLRAARALGVLHRGGLPAGFQVLGYESDTLYPTVVITDASGRVVFADQTDNYRVRPEPATFLAALDRVGAA